MISESLMNAICAIELNDQLLGTGFLISDRLVLTALHVVSYTSNDKTSTGDYRSAEFILYFRHYDKENPFFSTIATTTIFYNIKYDWTILYCKDSIANVHPLELRSLDEIPSSTKWFGYGFPSINQQGYICEGTILNLKQRNNDVDYIQLFSPQFAQATGLAANGMSGSPCLADSKVIGLNIIQKQDGNTFLGDLQAIPISTIFDQMKEILDSVKTTDISPGVIEIKTLIEEAFNHLPEPEPANQSYNAIWYIPWHLNNVEGKALDNLKYPGKPILIWGAPHSGKSYLLNHLLKKAKEEKLQTTDISVNFNSSFTDETKQNLDIFFKEMANLLVLYLYPEKKIWVSETWENPLLNGITKLKSLMETYILPAITGRFILAIDEADAIWDFNFRNDAFAMLRSWCVNHNIGNDKQRKEWSKFRLILTVSRSRESLIDSQMGSPFNFGQDIHLESFNYAQTKELVRLYGLKWSKPETTQIMDILGGNPYLTRSVMYDVKTNRESLSRIFDYKNNSLYMEHLNSFRYLLNKNKELEEELNLFKDGQPKDARNLSLCRKLVIAGLLKQNGSMFQLRCLLYQKLFD